MIRPRMIVLCRKDEASLNDGNAISFTATIRNEPYHCACEACRAGEGGEGLRFAELTPEVLAFLRSQPGWEHRALPTGGVSDDK